MTSDVTSSYAWNAESEIKTANSVNYTGVYPERSRRDGDGNRLEKSNGKIYWYGAGTEILEETDATGSMTNASFFEYVYFDGKRIARRNSSGNVSYYLEDALGTSRGIVEIAAGQTTVCYDADYYPYGGEKVYTNTCPQNYKFEGKERDTETGNDDFGARYYSSVYGRWLSPDWSSVPAPVPYANLNNPQTLNLYAMVADNPETFADLDGHDCQDDHGGSCQSKPTPAEWHEQRGAAWDYHQQAQQEGPKHRRKDSRGVVDTLARGLDWFNDTLGFGKSDCSSGGDCVNAIGMAVGAIIAAVVSDGESEEAQIQKQLSMSERRLANIARELEETLAAARREARGGMKIYKSDGTFYDHVREARELMNGANRQARHLERFLRKSGLSQSQVSKISGLIEQARGLAATALEAITTKESQ